MKDNDKTRPAQPEETRTVGPSSNVMHVFEEYVRMREAGEGVPIADFLARLATEQERSEFAGLAETLDWTEDRLPIRLRPNLILDDRYRLLEVIGSGGMGQVWRGVDEKIGLPVAIKVLNLLSTSLADAEPVMARETQLLARLDHPGIVKILDTGKDGEHSYLVMSLVDGKPLSEVLSKLRDRDCVGGARLGATDLVDAIDRPLGAGRTPVVTDEDWYRTCAKVMIEILRTLEAAHARHIVHRDLKPANVMLCGGANPVLLDFGLGGRLDTAVGDLSTGMFGTVAYIAPEQWEQGAIGSDPQTDIYQMGLILYELLTLKRAFPDDVSEAVQMIPQGLFRRPSQLDPRIPSALEHVCLEAMELDPSRRYGSAQELREDLARFLAGNPVRAERRKLGISTRRVRYFVRRHRRAMSTAAALALTATLTVVIGNWMMDGLDVTWQKVGQSFVVEPSRAQRVYAFVLFGPPGARGDEENLWGATHVCPIRLAGPPASGRALPEDEPPKYAEAEAGVHLTGNPERDVVYCDIPKFTDLKPVRLQVVTVDLFERETEVHGVITQFQAQMHRDNTRHLALSDDVKALWETVRDPGSTNTVQQNVGIEEFFGQDSWRHRDSRGAGVMFPR